MCKTNDNIERICSFYASEWHLLTKIIIYLKTQKKIFKHITFISQKALKSEFNYVLSKLNISQLDLNIFKNISWYDNTSDIKFNNTNIYIIYGSYTFIQKTNDFFTKKNSKKMITLINCYPIFNEKINFTNILKHNNKLLNTSEIKTKAEVFNSLFY